MLTFILSALFFLAGTFFLTAVNSALRQLHKQEERIKPHRKRFFYLPFHLFFFPNREEEGLFFVSLWSQSITRFCYAALCMVFLVTLFTPSWPILAWGLLCIALLFLCGEYIPRIVGTRFPDVTLRILTFPTSFFLLLSFPFAFLFLKVSHLFSKSFYLDALHEPTSPIKQELIDFIKEAYVSPTFDPDDKKLIESVIKFQDRIVREVMVPRVDVLSLEAGTPIKEAGRLLAEEGYSRVPIYRDTVDNIVGVLMYKDILEKYHEYEHQKNQPSILEAPIATIQKPPLYTPETKKISALLQEFRKKQTHLAIVVDEYGGTEGIVTIEDILEEIVGEIADEHDEEERLFLRKPDGSWIVDARMTINDAEEHLHIQIPQESDYDSIGGYIFHCAGTIPNSGFRIHRDEFEIEVLRSSERCVEQVRIKSLNPNVPPEQDNFSP